MFTRRRQNEAVPEVGTEAPEFNLPSAQGGQLRLSMRTARGPVVVAFFRGAWSEEDVEYFRALAEKEDELNLSAASVVGIGAVEPDEAREFARASGIKSFVLYDYARVTARQWGLYEKDKEHGAYTRPATFLIGTDHKVVRAWTDGHPTLEEIQSSVTEITGLPKPPEEDKPPETGTDGGKPKQTPAQPGQAGTPANAAEEEQAPKKMSKEERERIKAERRAAREAGKSLKASQPDGEAKSGESPGAGDAPKKMSKEERERIKAERRAARESGQSLKKPASDGEQSAAGESTAEGNEAEPAEGGEKPGDEAGKG